MTKIDFGDVDIMREKDNLRLLKIGCRNNQISYAVLGNGLTKHYDNYDDALEEFNLRWIKMNMADESSSSYTSP